MQAQFFPKSQKRILENSLKKPNYINLKYSFSLVLNNNRKQEKEGEEAERLEEEKNREIILKIYLTLKKLVCVKCIILHR